MSTWTNDELRRIGEAEELQLASQRSGRNVGTVRDDVGAARRR